MRHIFKVLRERRSQRELSKPPFHLELIDVTLKRSASRQLKFHVSSDSYKGGRSNRDSDEEV